MGERADDLERDNSGDIALPATLRGAFGFDGADDAGWFAALKSRFRGSGLGQIGSFDIIAEAGRGGQGLVYRARQKRPNREVALKRLAAGIFATPSMRARFEREIESAAALDHRNIVKVYGVEELDGQLAVAMQWIDGVPLDRWARPLSGPPRSIAETLGVFVIVCTAVAHAHQRGIIHRDLKPSNVLVDAAGQPHVLDFGLARRSDDSSDAGITLSGAFLGTPLFASPEQLRADNACVDVRSDIYSLGAMLYLCLTGSTPVERHSHPSEVLRQLEKSGPMSPAARDGRISRDLSEITLKALHFDPTQRYCSVEALLADLERYRRGEPVLAHAPTASYRLRKFVSRNRLAVGVVGGYFLVTTTAAVVSTILYFRAEHHRANAQAALIKANVEAGTARGSLSLLKDIFVSAGRGGSMRGGDLTVRTLLDRSAEKLESGGYSIDPAEVAGMRMMIGDAYRELGQNAAAQTQYRAALKLRREIFGAESLAVAQTLDALARVCRVLGDLKEAEPLIEQAWAAYVKAVPSRDPYLAQAASSVALIKRSLKKHEEAEKWYLEAESRYVSCFGPNSENVPFVKNNLGSLYVTMGRITDAESMFRDALERSQKLHADTPHEDTVMAMSSLADVLAIQGDPLGNADALFRASHQLALSLYGDNHFRVANLLVRFARFLAKNGRVEDALDALLHCKTFYENSQRWADALDASVEAAKLIADAGLSSDALGRLHAEVERIASSPTAAEATVARAYIELGALELHCGSENAARDWLQCAEAIYSRTASDASDDYRRLIALRDRIGRLD